MKMTFSDHIQFRPYFDPFDTDEYVAGMRRTLQGMRPRPRFDTMVCRGMSGNLVVPIMARTMRKNYLAIRKLGENSHDDGRCVGKLGARWIFVDDFIDSGKTFREAYGSMKKIVAYATLKEEPPFSEFVGVFLYSGYKWWTAEEAIDKWIGAKR